MEYNDIPYFSRKNKAKFSKMISENQRNQRDTKKCTVANGQLSCHSTQKEKITQETAI